MLKQTLYNIHSKAQCLKKYSFVSAKDVMGFMIKCVSVKGSLLACKCKGFLYDVKIGSSMFYLGMCNLVYEGFVDLGIMNDSVNVSELY